MGRLRFFPMLTVPGGPALRRVVVQLPGSVATLTGAGCGGARRESRT